MNNTDYAALKVGIVGAGLMGSWHANSIASLGAKLVAVADANESLAAQLARKFKAKPMVFSDIEQMLAHTQVDVLHICTPVESHFPIAMKAIDAGLNVIIEKPVATSLDKTKQLAKAAKEKNVILCPVHQFAFQDGVKKALSQLTSLGELLHLRFTVNSAGGVDQKNNTLNDIIADIIPHPLSVLQRIKPEIDFDSSHWSGVHSREGELDIIGEAGGVSLNISISMNARPTRCEMELFCSGGRIVLNFFHGYGVVEKGNVSRSQKLLQPFKYALNLFYIASANIVKRSLTGERAYPGLSGLIEAFYCSVKNSTISPISENEIINIAMARDDLVKRFLNT